MDLVFSFAEHFSDAGRAGRHRGGGVPAPMYTSAASIHIGGAVAADIGGDDGRPKKKKKKSQPLSAVDLLDAADCRDWMSSATGRC